MKPFLQMTAVAGVLAVLAGAPALAQDSLMENVKTQVAALGIDADGVDNLSEEQLAELSTMLSGSDQSEDELARKVDAFISESQ